MTDRPLLGATADDPDLDDPDLDDPDLVEPAPRQAESDDAEFDEAEFDGTGLDEAEFDEAGTAGVELGSVVLGEDPEGARRRRGPRTRWIVLGALVALLAVVAGVVVPLAWRLLTRQAVTLTAPPTLAGLTADTSDNANQTADYLRTAVAAKISLDTSVGAIYQDPASQDRDVLFFGGTAALLTPDRQLDQALSLLNDDSGNMTGIHTVDAGPLGGWMKCGTSTGDGGPVAVCGWADAGSIAVALFPGRSVDEAAALLGQMRAGMEHRN